MKKELSPAAVVAVILVVVIAVAVYGYRALRPAPYTPSPGVVDQAGTAQGQAKPEEQPAADVPYPVAPTGSIPGKPVENTGGAGG